MLNVIGGIAMNKKLVCLGMIFIILFSLFSCNGDAPVTEDTTTVAESTTEAVTSDTPNADTGTKNVIEIGETYAPITFPGVRKLSD